MIPLISMHTVCVLDSSCTLHSYSGGVESTNLTPNEKRDILHPDSVSVEKRLFFLPALFPAIIAAISSAASSTVGTAVITGAASGAAYKAGEAVGKRAITGDVVYLD